MPIHDTDGPSLASQFTFTTALEEIADLRAKLRQVELERDETATDQYDENSLLREKINKMRQAMAWKPISSVPNAGYVWVRGGWRGNIPDVIASDGEYWREKALAGNKSVPTEWAVVIIPMEPDKEA